MNFNVTPISWQCLSISLFVPVKIVALSEKMLLGIPHRGGNRSKVAIKAGCEVLYCFNVNSMRCEVREKSRIILQMLIGTVICTFY